METGAAAATLRLTISRVRGRITSLRSARRNNNMKETAVPQRPANANDPIMSKIKSKARAKLLGASAGCCFRNDAKDVRQLSNS